MRCSWTFTLAVFAALALPAQAQIGKRIVVRANSPEDKAMAEINAAAPVQKLALIDKFLAEYGNGDMAIVAYELYISYYQAEKNPDKVIEYAEKLLSADPENFAAGVNLVRAEQEKGDTQKLFAAGERVAGILARYKAEAPPEGTSASEWEQQRAGALAEARDNINYVEYALLSAGYQTRDPAARAALLERFAAAFPDSPYTAGAQALVAAAYQQAQNYPKMLDYAQKILVRDPNNLGMLLLLADYYSERGEQLDKAEQYAKKALDLLGMAQKPAGLSEEQWQKELALQKGLAWTSLGQVHIQHRRDAQALEAFRNAAPLLKPDRVTYARNQYRMGFALLNLKRVNEARAALTEAESIDSPYRAMAQEKLNTLPAAPAKKRS
jgi:tetratricopeptide (TPR) repeat protein